MTTTRPETVELPFVEEAMKQAVAREIANPTLSEAALRSLMAKTKLVIAGFDVDDVTRRADLIDEVLKKKWAHYGTVREKVIAELNRRGIEPIAVLSKTAWERLYRASGMYELRTDNAGCIFVSSDGLLNEAMKRRRKYMRIAFAGCLILCALCAHFTILHVFGNAVYQKMGPTFLVFDFLVTVLYGMIVSLMDMSFSIADSLSNAFEKMFLRKIAKRTTWSDALKSMMPGWVSQDSGTAVKVILPEPPAEVVSILLKAKDLPLKSVVDPDLFGFVGGVEGVLLNKQQDVADERRRMKELQRDPIVVWEDEGVVAIIAQFGESPIEKRVVELIMGQNDLI